MKKINKIILTLYGSIIFIPSVKAEKSYIDFAVIGSLINDTKEYEGSKSFGGSFGFGYDLNENISLEIGLQYNPDNSLKKKMIGGGEMIEKFSIISPMLKIFYNHKIHQDIKIYFGVGIGGAWVNTETSLKTNIPGSDKLNSAKIDSPQKYSLAIGGYTGISKIVNNMELGLGYSFGYYGKTAEENNDQNTKPLDIYINSINIGIKFHF
jgi:hypothetical protein